MKTGLDDFFVRGGTPDQFRELLEAAVPADGVAGDGYEYTDIGNGRRLADVAGHDVRFVADRDCWLAWDGNRWQSRGAEVRVEAIAKDMLLTWAKSAAGKIAKAAQALAEAETEEETNRAKVALAAARKELAFAKKSQDWRSVKRMIAAARSEPVVCSQSYRETFDCHPWLFNCPNGTIDQRTGELRPHAREDLLTRLCPIAYDPKAKAPMYLKFLSDIFRKRDKLVRYMRTLSGVICSGDVSTRTLHFFYGTGSNGKSVLIELWMETLGPDEYALKLPDGVLVNEGSNTQHPTELADLAGVRFAVANETEQTGKLAESRVKAMTGGDTMAARRMRQDFFRFDPSHKLVIASNYKPRIKGVDHGIWSRIRLCPFDVQFWTDADKDANPNKTFDEALKADPGLKAKLLAETPGVLADMIRAAGEFYRSGLILRAPKEILAATKDYRKAEDTIGEFFAERVVPDEDTVKQPKERNKVAAAGLHKAYRLWADDRGEKPCGSRTFGEYAKTRLEYGTSSGVGFYYCQLRDTPTPNDEVKAPAADQMDGEGGDSGDRFPDEQPNDKNASQGAYAKNDSHPPHPHQSGCGDLWAGTDLDALRM